MPGIPITRGAGAGVAFCVAVLAAVPAAAQGPTGLANVGHSYGAADAPIVIFEFLDFGCSACGLFARATLPQLDNAHIRPGRVRMHYVPFDAGFRFSREAAVAAECAAEQNAFRSMHDALFARQKEWMPGGNPRDRFRGYAVALDLDLGRFTACYDGSDARRRIERNTKIAHDFGLRGTPTFFINLRRVEGMLTMERLRPYLDPGR